MHEETYQKRLFQYLGCRQISGRQFKSYVIRAEHSEPVRKPLIAAANSYADWRLAAQLNHSDVDNGMGFMILHQGEMANWLLLYWWAYQDIMMRILASSERGSEQFSEHPEQAISACVWEHVVINHERDAWVTHMMKTPQQAEAYLSDVLKDGSY